MATSAFVTTSASISILRLQTPIASATRPNLRFRSNPQHHNLTAFNTTSPKSLTRNLNLTSTTPLLRSTPPENDSDVPESEIRIVDEWGDKAESEVESELTRFTEPDPAKDEDEWGKDDFGNGKVVDEVVETVVEVGVVEDAKDVRIGDLKQALVDTVYGTNLGFGASVEVRAEVLELVNQLEAANPTPAPVEAPELLGGNWVLV